jgi:DNA-binding LacI/PurR family transcriptional regulator
MWAHSGQTLAEYLGQGATVPVVYMGFAREDDSDYVAFDLYSGARELAEHLVERGYERIAYVSAYAIDKSSREDRYRAYRDVCALNNLPTELLVTEDERETREAGLALGRAIAAMPAELRPQALMCHNDVIAVGLYCGLRRSGLRVPEDIAVAGFDGIEEAQYLDVPLTTVRTPGSAIAQQAVQILSRRLAGDVEDGPCQVLLPAQLLIGGST